MKDLFYTGGPFIMSVLTGLLILMLVWSFYYFLQVLKKRDDIPERSTRSLSYIKSIGLFAMITGILYQLIGFYQAFSAIEIAGDVSSSLFYAGLRISMITTIYGIFIYLFSILMWFILDNVLTKRMLINEKQNAK